MPLFSFADFYDLFKSLRNMIRVLNCLYLDQDHWSISVLSLSDTEHGWAHGSNTVYSVIHGLPGMSIELQPCLGTIWTRM